MQRVTASHNVHTPTPTSHWGTHNIETRRCRSNRVNTALHLSSLFVTSYRLKVFTTFPRSIIKPSGSKVTMSSELHAGKTMEFFHCFPADAAPDGWLVTSIPILYICMSDVWWRRVYAPTRALFTLGRSVNNLHPVVSIWTVGEAPYKILISY